MAIISQGFLGESAPRIQKIALGGTPFSALPNLLWCCGNLVILQLLNMPKSVHISPETMVTSLCRLSPLKVLKTRTRDLESHYPAADIFLRVLDLLFQPSPNSLSTRVANIGRHYDQSRHSFPSENYHIFLPLTDLRCFTARQFICPTEGLGSSNRATMIFRETAVSPKFQAG